VRARAAATATRERPGGDAPGRAADLNFSGSALATTTTLTAALDRGVLGALEWSTAQLTLPCLADAASTLAAYPTATRAIVHLERPHTGSALGDGVGAVSADRGAEYADVGVGEDRLQRRPCPITTRA
jgi:hypothetical protein